MTRARLPLLLTLAALALAGTACDRGPTGVDERLPASIGEAGQQPEVGDDLEALIEALFPAPGLRNAALVQVRNVVRAMESDDPATAAEQAMDLIDFAVEHHAAGNLLPAAPSTEAVLASLIAEISEVAGLGTPTLGAEAFGESGAIVHVDESGGEAVTPDRTIGVVFPPGSLPDDTVIVITPIAVTGEPAEREGPLPTDLDQYPLFAEISTIPAVPQLGEPAVVGVCVVDPPDPYAPTATVAARLRLAHTDPDDPSTIEILPLADASFLDCTGASTGSNGSLAPAGRHLSLSEPGRLGGAISSFSPFAAVDPESGGPTITILPTLFGEPGAAYAINDAGQIVGRSHAGCEWRAVLWESGTIIDLASGVGSGCEQTEAQDINNVGQVVGTFDVLGFTAAFLWENGTMTFVDPSLDWSFGLAINDFGQVLGRSENGYFLWEAGVTTPLDPLIDQVSDINDQGQILGSTADDRALLWSDGIPTYLGTLGGGHIWPSGLNDSGQVVGESETASGEIHAFLWDDGVMTDLGTLGGDYSVAYAINNAGQVVGESLTASGEWHAFLWENGVMTDLGVNAPGRGSAAYDINEAGQIVGEDKNGGTHPIVWTF